MHDLILVKLVPIVTKILDSPRFSVIACCSLTWPQNLISTSMNPNTSVMKIGWKSLHWFFWYGVHKVLADSLTHGLIHGWTDPYTECHWNRFSTVVEAQ